MKFEFMRHAVVLGSVIVASVIPSQAFAQTAAFTGINSLNGLKQSFLPITATYTFNKSMIVNSIGMVDTNLSDPILFYVINDGPTIRVNANYTSGNIRWYDFSEGLSLQQGDQLKLRTIVAGSRSLEYRYDSFDLGPDVTFGGTTNSASGSGFTNSSIKVSPSNPGSNVAPEPGTFALALTGGGALLGICIRRRRIAG